MNLPQKHNPERVLSFVEHLEELRGRVIICLVFFIVTLLGGFWFAPRVIEWLITPLRQVAPPPPETTLTFKLAPDGTLHLADPLNTAATTTTATLTTQTLAAMSNNRVAIEIPGREAVTIGNRSASSLFFLSPIEPFMLLIQGALLISAVFTIPMIVYQMWLFIAPGLLRKERRIVGPVILSSFILFPTGAMFAYYVSRLALQILIGFSDQIPGLEPSIVASKYIGFILTMMIVFGVFFEFPLVLVLLSRFGIIDARYLAERRRWAILIMAVVAAAATPTPDPINMCIMLAPLIILYEGSIVVIRILDRAGPVRQPDATEVPEE
ncbi:MAG: twin-arginine translocase subunit TatC [Candidatus Sumerlaeaceae bacterium]|nr:twin-arginine translocase subunit TatC [Candidatus Sumerlaeaceae bacterium]